MRYDNIKKASQKQTTTANKNYIKNFVRFKKTKLYNKVKTALDESETKRLNFYFTRKNIKPVHSKAW